MDKTFVRTTVCRPFIWGGGGGYSLSWPIRGCVARLGGHLVPRFSLAPWERVGENTGTEAGTGFGSRETAYIISSESVLHRVNNFV